MSGSGAISGGTATWSSVWTPTAAQTYYWRASYSGDSNNNGYTSTCDIANERIVVGKASPTISTDIHDTNHHSITSGYEGITVHDSATVNGIAGLASPTGVVYFTWFTNGTCEGAGIAGTDILLAAGVAHPSEAYGPLGVGSYSFKAYYKGDSLYDSGSSQCEPLIVRPAPAGSKALTGTNQDESTEPNVFIGEMLVYETKFTLYPGTVANLKLVDLLDEGLAFVDCESVAYDGILTSHQPCVDPGTPLITDVGPNGDVDKARQVEFDFGDSQNSDTLPHTITVTYRVVVLDSSANIRGKTLQNTAVWSWNDILSPAAHADVTIIEPSIEITKAISPSVISSGGTTNVTIVINHTADSNATAFDMVWTDSLPMGTEYVPGTINFAGQAPDDFDVSDIHNLTATWSRFTIAGGPVTITFKIKVTLPGGISASNTTNVQWSSLPEDIIIPQTPNNPLSTERFYDPASPVDVYGASAEARVTAKSSTDTPGTGFAPGVITVLSPQPADMTYASNGDLYLEIPKIKEYVKIVGVPQNKSGWDVTWLGKQAGYLYGTAYPTWNGNSVITAHVYDADGNPGPFVNLGKLKWGDWVIIHAYGQQYIYEVRQILNTKPDDPALLKHEDRAWVTLITCQGWDARTNTYASRLAVRAVLIKIQPEGNGSSSQ